MRGVYTGGGDRVWHLLVEHRQHGSTAALLRFDSLQITDYIRPWAMHRHAKTTNAWRANEIRKEGTAPYSSGAVDGDAVSRPRKCPDLVKPRERLAAPLRARAWEPAVVKEDGGVVR